MYAQDKHHDISWDWDHISWMILKTCDHVIRCCGNSSNLMYVFFVLKYVVDHNIRGSKIQEL